MSETIKGITLAEMLGMRGPVCDSKSSYTFMVA